MVKQEQAEKIEQGGAHAFVRVPFDTYAIFADCITKATKETSIAIGYRVRSVIAEMALSHDKKWVDALIVFSGGNKLNSNSSVACRRARNLMLTKLLEYEIECNISTRSHNGP